MRSVCRAGLREEISRLRKPIEPEKVISGVPAGLADDFAENPRMRVFKNGGAGAASVWEASIVFGEFQRQSRPWGAGYLLWRRVPSRVHLISRPLFGEIHQLNGY